MDILFARLNLDQLPADLALNDVELLKELEPASVRSLNGTCLEFLSEGPISLESYLSCFFQIILRLPRHG